MTASSSSGRVIAVLGPDGSGKSTFADALVAGPLNRETILRLHHRPGAFVSKSPSETPVTEPHAGDPYPRTLALAKLMFLFLDFQLGWWTRIKPFVRRGGWVVWERPWWDISIDPTRYRLQGSERAARVLGAGLPVPDLVIVLEAPVDVLLGRKREVSEAELERQTHELHHVVPAKVRTVFLDSREPIPTLLQRATEQLESLRSED
jgi:thymidylate kinase